MQKYPLTKASKDKAGNYTDDKLIGTIWLHTGNNKLYKVLGYVWNGDTDCWHIRYAPYFLEPGGYVTHTRSIDNFKGRRGEKLRFIKIEGARIDGKTSEEMEDE